MTPTKKKILIVEDLPELLEELVLLMEDEGFDATGAANGQAALKYLESNTVDMVISDIFMPEMDGIALIKNRHSHFPDAKIILISGGGRNLATSYQYDCLESAQHVYKTDAILKKPFDGQELLDVTRRLLA